MSENNANIVALIGASGQGKSLTFKQWLKAAKPARLILADFMDEYAEHAARCATLEDVVKATEAATFAVRYVPRGEPDKLWERFDVLCRIAFERGKTTLGVEELNMVTRANGGPHWWGECTLRGRHRELVIVGLSQRPALVDKNFFSNATRIRCFRLNFDADVATMAGVLGVDQDAVRNLKPLEFIERDMGTGAVAPGVLEVAASAPKAPQPAPPAPAAADAVKRPRGRPRKKRR